MSLLLRLGQPPSAASTHTASLTPSLTELGLSGYDHTDRQADTSTGIVEAGTMGEAGWLSEFAAQAAQPLSQSPWPLLPALAAPAGEVARPSKQDIHDSASPAAVSNAAGVVDSVEAALALVCVVADGALLDSQIAQGTQDSGWVGDSVCEQGDAMAGGGAAGAALEGAAARAAQMLALMSAPPGAAWAVAQADASCMLRLTHSATHPASQSTNNTASEVTATTVALTKGHSTKGDKGGGDGLEWTEGTPDKGTIPTTFFDLPGTLSTLYQYTHAVHRSSAIMVCFTCMNEQRGRGRHVCVSTWCVCLSMCVCMCMFVCVCVDVSSMGLEPGRWTVFDPLTSPLPTHTHTDTTTTATPQQSPIPWQDPFRTPFHTDKPLHSSHSQHTESLQQKLSGTTGGTTAHAALLHVRSQPDQPTLEVQGGDSQARTVETVLLALQGSVSAYQSLRDPGKSLSG